MIATLGLLLVIFALARSGRSRSAPAAVGAYIGAAYLFTSSTSFANPAITVGRMFSDTFAGIAPSSVPPFTAAQILGGIAAAGIIKALYPAITPADAAGHHRPPPRRTRPGTGQHAHHSASLSADGRPPGPVRLLTRQREGACHAPGHDRRQRRRDQRRPASPELDPAADVTVVLADAYPNFSICGIPDYLSGEVPHWRNLAHRTVADLEAAGIRLRPGHHRPAHRRARPQAPGHLRRRWRGTAQLRQAPRRHRRGPGPAPDPRPDRSGALGPADGVHLLHSMGDTFAVMATLQQAAPASAVIVGAGYIGLEMADALTVRGLQVTQMEQLAELLPPWTRSWARWSTPNWPPAASRC